MILRVVRKSPISAPSPQHHLPDDLAELKRIIAAMALDARTAQPEIARLKFQLARAAQAVAGRRPG